MLLPLGFSFSKLFIFTFLVSVTLILVLQYSLGRILYNEMELLINELLVLRYKPRPLIVFNGPDTTDTNSSKCEVIHIGIVCIGFKYTVHLYTMLKSIFFYRSKPLHFHVLVDSRSRMVLTTLFETWAVPQATVSLYNTKDAIPYIRWVPNSHYSGLYGLLKLTFPRIIPANIADNIIILDTDLIFTGDIYELWDLFKHFNETQVIGLVENQSDYYLRKIVKKPWPASGRGYNSGVILYCLKRLRNMQWDYLWANTVNKTTALFGKAMGDQDILNALIKDRPELLYKLPCSWNVQLGDHTNSYNCYKNSHPKIIHWNSPKKLKVKHDHGKKFRPIYDMFIKYNGNLVLQTLHDCLPTPKILNATSGCFKYSEAASRPWRTLIYFSSFKYTPTKNDVTLVSYLPFSKLAYVEKIAQYWNGPISISLYITDEELYLSLDFIQNSQILRKRFNIAYHAVFNDQNYYPVNKLRNVALNNVLTPYVMQMEADFLPSQNLYIKLKKYIAELADMDKKALLVPVFVLKKQNSAVPNTKTEIQMMWNTNELGPKYLPTNYETWSAADVPYQISWEPSYQPYVLHKFKASTYDERFFDPIWSKTLYTMMLKALDYQFIVLPDVFMVTGSSTNDFYQSGLLRKSGYKRCLKTLKKQSIAELNAKYNQKFNVDN